jgi:FkbM family methyltransferase
VNIGRRNIRKLIYSLCQAMNYITFYNMLKVYKSPLDMLMRYIFNIGNYPLKINIRTPIGIITPLIYNNDDLINVNCIFCRLDYYARNDIKYVVDIGSNIGISALYFLSRNSLSIVYLYEPVPENINKLKQNLSNFQGRYELNEIAVYSKSGVLDFGVEETGLYGGIDIETGEYIKVNCKNINDVLKEVFSKIDRIDLLKIDIEGKEYETLMAINDKYLNNITKIYAEMSNPPLNLLSIKYGALFTIKKYGNILVMDYAG